MLPLATSEPPRTRSVGKYRTGVRIVPRDPLRHKGRCGPAEPPGVETIASVPRSPPRRPPRDHLAQRVLQGVERVPLRLACEPNSHECADVFWVRMNNSSRARPEEDV